MAVSRVGGKNGSITGPAGFNADFAAFDFEASQVVEEDTAYSATAESHIGGGIPGYRATARGFMRKGAASSSPGFAALGSNITGATSTFQFDTGCTVATTVVTERISTSHSIKSAAIALNYSLIASGAITETWATT